MIKADDDTIAAIATAVGGGIGIIRLSGPDAIAIARRHFDGFGAESEPRRLIHGIWRDADDNWLDEGLAVLMPAPHSYTGEDVAELQLHGGALALQRCLDVCWSAGARPAEAGEFTKRAFLNGRMDLTRAEAVADLISARTEQALRQARSHLAGRLYELAQTLRDRILRLRAMLEVNIDFVEEDVPPIDVAGLSREARDVSETMMTLAATWSAGHLWRDGARVVLAGRPNAGKSSLFNALLDTDRAIVTPVAGTTRDTVEETVDVLGVPVVLVDTAGLRETADIVEAAGVSRTERQLEVADAVIYVIDPAVAEADWLDADGTTVPVIKVHSKRDLHVERDDDGSDVISVSSITREGLDQLKQTLVETLGGQASHSAGLTIGRARHRLALERAAAALDDAASGLDEALPHELVCVEVQEATDALGELVGFTSIEDVLDQLFSTFCIGK